MNIKKLSIGSLTTKNNLFLAPLAGFSDKAFRRVCTELGASLCFTEMVSAKGLKYNNKATSDLLTTSEVEKITAVQLFGNAPEIMRSACESDYLKKFDLVDINMGCPVPKVFNNGEGSALLNNIDLAQKIVEECVKSGKTISVKMRLGVEKNTSSAIELAQAVEKAGAKMITVHGRTREDYYSGQVNYDIIAKIKENAKVPVIGNGNIFSVSDAETMFNRTNCDGIMLARGAIFSPELFSLLQNITPPNKKEIILRHLELMLLDYPEKIAVVKLRKQLASYVHGLKNSKTAKLKIFEATTAVEIKNALDEIEF